MLLRIHNIAGLPEGKVFTRGSTPGLAVYRSGWSLVGLCLVIAGPWRPTAERIALCGPGKERTLCRLHWSRREGASRLCGVLRSWPAFPQGGN